MFKISVIIPCYNVEAYIDRCLESIMSQSIGLEHLEVILVNDASTDQTLEKLYQWEQNFAENIMVMCVLVCICLFVLLRCYFLKL